MYKKIFDVIVVGGGHSGIEASSACSRMKRNTLLVTSNIDTIGQMSCNPSIGGIGKSHLVKEIDAMGGLMAISSDYSGIQFRKLNISKGPAVRSTRVQTDKLIYQKTIKKILNKEKNLLILQQKVTDLIIKNNKIYGIITESGIKIFSKTVILTMGTFLNGKVCIGTNYIYKGGRYSDRSSTKLSNCIQEFSSIKRFKTGTPPRISLNSINFNKLNIQYGDIPIPRFSFFKKRIKLLKQIPCHITNTNEYTHKIIKDNINKSPIYSDIINSVGPRYCPSIEDKIIKFPDKNSHQIFLEQEGLNSNEIYPNGISMSLPLDIQIKVISSIKGMEKSLITRPGYLVEYDFFNPKNLKLTLESKFISGLFFAGQINGTTGYEEAASQGIIAGLNASLLSKDLDLWIPKRNISYIGVMINDLCNKEIFEPYRMFTSRSEHRLILREDNAYDRLTEIAYNFGLLNDNKWKVFCKYKNLLNKVENELKNFILIKKNKEVKILNKYVKKKIVNNINVYDLFKINELNYKIISRILYRKKNLDNDLNKILEKIEIQSKYENYIKKQNKEIEKIEFYKNIKIPDNIDYKNIIGLSNESIDNLLKIKPKSIEEALNISGINYSNIFLLILWIKKK